ncbi:MAG: ABC transporter ATP-binding protein [Oscillospiraceae bacterium]
MSFIEIKNLYKTYNWGKPTAFKALKDINLTVEKGEIIAIMGKSGAGKSTLLHILGTLDIFENGIYKFNDIIINKLKESEKSLLRAEKIGFVLQDFGLIQEESVFNNVNIPLYFDKTKLSEIKNKTISALDKIDINEIMNKKIKHLSGGQKQRVAIARAIVNNPDIILADEPTGALDTSTSEKIMEVFKQLNNEGKTIIIVTHENTIAQYCQRKIIINDGKIISDEN